MIHIKTKTSPNLKSIIATLYNGPTPVNVKDYTQRIVKKYDVAFNWYDNHRHAAIAVLYKYNKKIGDLKLAGETQEGFWFKVLEEK